MLEIKGGFLFVRMFLKIGVFFRCFFLERGKDIFFIIENKNRLNGVEWNCIFFFKGKMCYFDVVMEYDEWENRIFDYFGKFYIFLFELYLEVFLVGGFVIIFGKQWFLIGGKKILLLVWLCGSLIVYEVYDEEMNCFSIKVYVKNWIFGIFFFYWGIFWEIEGEIC